MRVNVYPRMGSSRSQSSTSSIFGIFSEHSIDLRVQNSMRKITSQPIRIFALLCFFVSSLACPVLSLVFNNFGGYICRSLARLQFFMICLSLLRNIIRSIGKFIKVLLEGLSIYELLRTNQLTFNLCRWQQRWNCLQLRRWVQLKKTFWFQRR